MSSAMPSVSKPGPRLADVAGTRTVTELRVRDISCSTSAWRANRHGCPRREEQGCAVMPAVVKEHRVQGSPPSYAREE